MVGEEFFLLTSPSNFRSNFVGGGRFARDGLDFEDIVQVILILKQICDLFNDDYTRII